MLSSSSSIDSLNLLPFLDYYSGSIIVYSSKENALILAEEWLAMLSVMYVQVGKIASLYS